MTRSEAIVTEHALRLEPAGDRRSEAIALIASCDLPTADLGTSPVELTIALSGDALIGVIGLEVVRDVGLLRSLAVAPDARHRRVARALCEHVLVAARDRRLGVLYLLTTTARGYFERLGFKTLSRDDVPEGLRGTAEFRELCPSTATAMHKPMSSIALAFRARARRGHRNSARGSSRRSGW
jgi:amino-acid N-acetyltransferase